LGAVEKFKEAGDAEAGGEEVDNGRCAKKVPSSLPIKVTVEEDV